MFRGVDPARISSQRIEHFIMAGYALLHGTYTYQLCTRILVEIPLNIQ